jgi:hypothetical protein
MHLMQLHRPVMDYTPELIQALLNSDEYLDAKTRQSIIETVFSRETTSPMMGSSDFIVENQRELFKRNPRYNSRGQKKNLSQIIEIIDYVQIKSDGNRRKCGNLEIRHPGFAAVFGLALGLEDLIIKALELHDHPEDRCGKDIEVADDLINEIGKKYGKNLGSLCDDLTNFSELLSQQVIGNHPPHERFVAYTTLGLIKDDIVAHKRNHLLTYFDEVKRVMDKQEGPTISRDQMKTDLFEYFIKRMIKSAEEKRIHGDPLFFAGPTIKSIEEWDNVSTTATTKPELESVVKKYEIVAKYVSEYAQRLKRLDLEHELPINQIKMVRYGVNTLILVSDALKLELVRKMDIRARQFKLETDTSAYEPGLNFVEKKRDTYKKDYGLIPKGDSFMLTTEQDTLLTRLKNYIHSKIKK